MNARTLKRLCTSENPWERLLGEMFQYYYRGRGGPPGRDMTSRSGYSIEDHICQVWTTIFKAQKARPIAPDEFETLWQEAIESLEKHLNSFRQQLRRRNRIADRKLRHSHPVVPQDGIDRVEVLRRRLAYLLKLVEKDVAHDGKNYCKKILVVLMKSNTDMTWPNIDLRDDLFFKKLFGCKIKYVRNAKKRLRRRMEEAKREYPD